MNRKDKKHAKDYLLEYQGKKIQKWLNLLIKQVINTAGAISKNDKDEIFKIFIQENQLNFDQKAELSQLKHKLTSSVGTEKTQKEKNEILILKKITHKRGINALIHDQSLPFNPTCTIIYGLNATGKSGYYRIIHELAGGEQPKTILANIHKPSEDLEVYVDFQLNGKEQPTYVWREKKERGVYPFNQIKVFDSEYLPIFLDERESSSSVEPLGLNLFQVITNVMDEFKYDKLEKLKQKVESQKPDLQPLVELLHSKDLRLILSKTVLAKDNKKLLKEYQSFSDKDSKKLQSLKSRVQKLDQNNLKDSIKLLTQEKSEIDSLNEHLASLKKMLEDISKKIPEAIQNYSHKKKVRDEKKESFAVLKNIPARDSEEWQTFIESARNYEKTIDKRDFKSEKRCIYCHQPLTLGSTALKLVQAYSQYLSDQSQQDFREAENIINELRKRLKLVEPKFIFSVNLATALTDTEKEDNNIKILVDQIILNAEQQKTFLEKTLNNLDTTTVKYSIDLSKVKPEISFLSTQKQKEIYDLSQTELEKKQKIEELQEDINKLEDKQNINNWKNRIDKYFSVNEKSQKYEAAINTISTRGITDLGSKASSELLTENIRKSFEDELKALGKDIEVSLKRTGAGKGKVRTQLKILGEKVCDILSKGEQNAVGLALFLAEINQQENQPVVFDDPVTSLDHEVRESLSERLMKLSRDRQMIIFTHDLLFASQLVKNGSKQNIKFSTHVIDRPSFGIGRINVNTSPKMSNLTNLIGKYTEAFKDYDNLDFDKQQKAIATALDYLRCSCECLIEEVLFAGTIQRYDDHVRVQNLEEAVLEREFALKIVNLHGEISEKAMMHNRSDFKSQEQSFAKDFINCRKKFEKLYEDLKGKKRKNIKKRNKQKKTQKKDYRNNW